MNTCRSNRHLIRGRFKGGGLWGMHGSAPLVVFIVVIIGHIQHQGNGTHLLFLICTGPLISQATYVLIGVGSTILSVTIIELISVQSPYSMKDLLFGTYFAITDVYQFISSTLLVPFTSRKLQSDGVHPPHGGCLFSILLLLCLIAFDCFC